MNSLIEGKSNSININKNIDPNPNNNLNIIKIQWYLYFDQVSKFQILVVFRLLFSI